MKLGPTGLGLLASILLLQDADAAVRKITVSSDAISPIYLSMGRSTVLRFRERPKKVVIGNQNYFNVEFIESDLAIQPLGAVETNLFIYGEFHTYGLALKVNKASVSDDLVFVSWKLPKFMEIGGNSAPAENPYREHALKGEFAVADLAKVTMRRVLIKKDNALCMMDFEIQNTAKAVIATDKVGLELRSKAKGTVEIHERAFEKRDIKPSETERVRIFFARDALKQPMTLTVLVSGKSVSIPIRKVE